MEGGGVGGCGGGCSDSESTGSRGDSVVKALHSTPGATNIGADSSDLPVVGGLIVQVYTTFPGGAG